MEHKADRHRQMKPELPIPDAMSDAEAAYRRAVFQTLRLLVDETFNRVEVAKALELAADMRFNEGEYPVYLGDIMLGVTGGLPPEDREPIPFILGSIPHDPRAHRACEAAYRRGFSQALACAHSANFDHDDLADACDIAMQFRYDDQPHAVFSADVLLALRERPVRDQSEDGDKVSHLADEWPKIRRIPNRVGMVSSVGLLKTQPFPLDFGNYFSFDESQVENSRAAPVAEVLEHMTPCLNMWAENAVELSRRGITDFEVADFGGCVIVIDERVDSAWFIPTDKYDGTGLVSYNYVLAWKDRGVAREGILGWYKEFLGEREKRESMAKTQFDLSNPEVMEPLVEALSICPVEWSSEGCVLQLRPHGLSYAIGIFRWPSEERPEPIADPAVHYLEEWRWIRWANLDDLDHALNSWLAWLWKKVSPLAPNPTEAMVILERNGVECVCEASAFTCDGEEIIRVRCTSKVSQFIAVAKTVIELHKKLSEPAS